MLRRDGAFAIANMSSPQMTPTHLWDPNSGELNMSQELIEGGIQLGFPILRIVLRRLSQRRNDSAQDLTGQLRHSETHAFAVSILILLEKVELLSPQLVTRACSNPDTVGEVTEKGERWLTHACLFQTVQQSFWLSPEENPDQTIVGFATGSHRHECPAYSGPHV